jgi:protein-L-isoaspartate(D-aspartate) O-methyltransferase
MVEEQIRPFGVTDERVLAAMGSVLRHEFLPETMWDRAYGPDAVARPDGETVTAPRLTAYVVESLGLDADSRVLECGTRSGWQTAVLAACAGKVVTIDARPEATRDAGRTLTRLGLAQVRLLTGDPLVPPDGEAPFDAVVVNGFVRHVPKALYAALRTGGRIVAPIGTAGEPQTLVRVVKGENDPAETRALLTVRYAPLAR